MKQIASLSGTLNSDINAKIYICKLNFVIYVILLLSATKISWQRRHTDTFYM
jgi:hypothetical protein